MIISRTPFRISFFGGGTDYPVWFEKNGGSTLSTTIDKYCYLLARHYPPFFPAKYRVVWSKIESTGSFDEIEHPSVRETLRHMGVEDGLEIHNIADLPARSGMGSSSAFTVGLLHALYGLKKQPVSKMQLAKEAIHVEQNLIKENVGSQDQVAAAFGGLNRIDFNAGGSINVNPVLMDGGRMENLNDCLMLFFTGFSRTASEIASEWIKSAPKKDQELKAMHRMVDDALRILQDKSVSLNEFGGLLHEAWQIKRGLADSITTDHIDEIYANARQAGAIGGKLLGAGHGGFMLLFVEPEKQAAVRRALGDLQYVPFRFENSGSQIIRNEPAYFNSNRTAKDAAELLAAWINDAKVQKNEIN